MTRIRNYRIMTTRSRGKYRIQIRKWFRWVWILNNLTGHPVEFLSIGEATSAVRTLRDNDVLKSGHEWMEV